MFWVKGKLKWIVIIMIALLAGIAITGKLSGGTSAEVIKVSKGEIKQYVDDTAQVLSRERQAVYIEGSGKVKEINYDVGDAVKKGDKLLSLDKGDIELQLQDAEAKVQAAKAQLKGTDMVNYVNKVDQARALVDQSQVSYDTAGRNYESAKKLFDTQAISKEEFERAQDEYKAAQATLNTAKLQLADARKGAPDYLRNSYEAQLEQAVIYRDTILRNIGKQDVTADMGGVILERLVERNSVIQAGSVAFVIASVENLELEADILTDDVRRIKVGNQVEISGKPMGDGTIMGEIVKIAPSAKNVTSSLGVNQKRVTVTIKLQDVSKLLKPGYKLDIKIITEVRDGAIVVPDTSVFDYKGKSGVLTLNGGNKAVFREVKKGVENGDFIEVLEGLQEGETVLVKPDNNIKEGAKIKPLVKSGKESG